MPFCGYGFLIGFAVGCLLSYFGDAKLGVAVMVIFFFLGMLGDMAQIGWRIYWRLTQCCGFCSKQVNVFTRARVFSDDLKHSMQWFCSPRCYTEWHRRHFSERKQINILSEGEPLIKFPKE